MTTKKNDPASVARSALSQEAIDALVLAHQDLPIPPALPGLFPIVRNLCVLENDVRRLLRPHGFEAQALFSFARGADSVPESHPARGYENLTGKIRRGRGTTSKRVDPPLYGFYKEYAVWSALWYQQGGADAGSEAAISYRALQAQYLAAYIILRRKDDVPQKPDRVYEAGRFLRTIHQPEDELICQQLALQPDFSPFRARDRLLVARERLRKRNDHNKAHGLATLAQLIRIAHNVEGKEEFVERTRSRKAHVARNRPRFRLRSLHPDHSQYSVFVRTGGLGTLEARGVAIDVNLPAEAHDPRQGELGDLGVDPWEYPSYGDALITMETVAEELGGQAESSPGSLPHLGTLMAIARARARHVAMGSQRLPVAYQRVRLAEIQDLVHVISQAYEDARSWQTQTQQEERRRTSLLRTLRVAAACLVTGADPSEFASRQMPLITGIGQLPAQYTIALNQQHRMWIRPYEPPDRRPMTSAQTVSAMETWPRVVFPDSWGVTRTDELDAPATWSAHRTTTYKQLWSEIVDRYGPLRIRPKWLPLHAVSWMLPSWCRSLEEGDHLPWRLLFADNDALAATHHYYTAYDRERLARHYETVMETLGAEIGLSDRADGTSISPMLARTPMAWDAPNSLVGDDRVARIESVETLVRRARHEVENTPPSNPYAYHNAQATYVALVLALVTGYRAVRTPFVDVSAVDWATGLMCLQEKDRNDGVHARFVLLPPTLRKQLQIYLQHLRQLWLRLPSARHAALSVRATKSRDRSAFGTGHFDLDLTHTLFLFDHTESRRPVATELTGNQLRARLDTLAPGHWPVANAGRHLLRTFLTNRGVDATVINALMGHASYGEEPWAPESGLDPWLWREQLEDHLEKLLGVVGFEVAGDD